MDYCYYDFNGKGKIWMQMEWFKLNMDDCGLR